MVDLNNPNIPIIGQTKPIEGPNAPTLTANCDIHDSEIAEIERVLTILNTKARDRQRVSYDAFQREIIERFQDLGFIVSVAWYDAGTPDGARIPGMYIPEITIRDRVEKHAFDHDQKTYEVTNDLLGLGDGGVISTAGMDPETFKNAHSHKH